MMASISTTNLAAKQRFENLRLDTTTGFNANVYLKSEESTAAPSKKYYDSVIQNDSTSFPLS